MTEIERFNTHGSVRNWGIRVWQDHVNWKGEPKTDDKGEVLRKRMSVICGSDMVTIFCGDDKQEHDHGTSCVFAIAVDDPQMLREIANVLYEAAFEIDGGGECEFQEIA